MINRLEPIIIQKKKELGLLQEKIAAQPNHPIAKIMRGDVPNKLKSFKQALRGDVLGVIAEVKRKSPSKGVLSSALDAKAMAKTYIDGGANAISVLTDQLFFGGTTQDLSDVASVVNVPILRKDFLLDPLQIAEAIAIGADAVLGVVKVLGTQLKSILKHAERMGIEVLVEVHDKKELDLALNAGAVLIGINNRNLSTFEVDTELAFTLLEHIPAHCVRIAESGIFNPILARDYYHAGFDAVLIGEALVTGFDPSFFIKECRNVD